MIRARGVIESGESNNSAISAPYVRIPPTESLGAGRCILEQEADSRDLIHRDSDCREETWNEEVIMSDPYRSERSECQEQEPEPHQDCDNGGKDRTTVYRLWGIDNENGDVDTSRQPGIL